MQPLRREFLCVYSTGRQKRRKTRGVAGKNKTMTGPLGKRARDYGAEHGLRKALFRAICMDSAKENLRVLSHALSQKNTANAVKGAASQD